MYLAGLIRFILCFAVLAWIIMHQVFYNPTSSLPRGYYFSYTSYDYRRGDLVIFCVWDTSQLKIMHQLKLPYTDSACPGRSPYLIKRIAAVATDNIEITAAGIKVNTQLYPNSLALAVHNKVILSRFLPDKFKLKAYEFLVMGDTPHSYDSRYFGVIKQEQIYKKAYLLYRTDKPF